MRSKGFEGGAVAIRMLHGVAIYRGGIRAEVRRIAEFARAYFLEELLAPFSSAYRRSAVRTLIKHDIIGL